MKNSRTLLLMLPLIGLMTLSCNSQDLHPYKKDFADFQSWPFTTPADITFDNFRSYRAVYNRTYIHGKTGETVNDQVIMIAQRVFWYGKTVILFEYQDTGTPDVKDTNGRTQFYYLDEKTLQMHLAVGPKAGTPLDYTTVRVLDNKITTTRLNTETGEVDFKELETSEPSFGFKQIRFLMWAAMDLKVGDKIKLNPIFHAPQNVQSPSLGIVKEQVDYVTPDNEKFRPFVIDNTNEATSPKVTKFFVINEAPYLLAQGLYNADDDEIYRWWLKLESFELLEEN